MPELGRLPEYPRLDVLDRVLARQLEDIDPGQAVWLRGLVIGSVMEFMDAVLEHALDHAPCRSCDGVVCVPGCTAPCCEAGCSACALEQRVLTSIHARRNGGR